MNNPVHTFSLLERKRVIGFQIISQGTLDSVLVRNAEIFRFAAMQNAASIILAHNHPSGTVQPSRADEALTQTLKAALALVDVRVLDHVIVAPGGALSMAEQGLL